VCVCHSDALLADLQTTRALNGNVTVDDDYNIYDDDDAASTAMYYQHEQRQAYSDSPRRPSPTPPPLPPLPSREVLDTLQPSTVSCILLV